jgi:hypothetical protein
MRTFKCPSGMILIKGYTKNKGKTIVKSRCLQYSKRSMNASIRKKMKSRCKRNNKKYHRTSKCNILFHLEKGTLSKFGYSMKKSQQSRHKSLKKAIKSVKPLSIYRKLNALYILNKNKYPDNAKIFKDDAEWLNETVIK